MLVSRALISVILILHLTNTVNSDSILAVVQIADLDDASSSFESHCDSDCKAVMDFPCEASIPSTVVDDAIADWKYFEDLDGAGNKLESPQLAAQMDESQHLVLEVSELYVDERDIDSCIVVMVGESPLWQGRIADLQNSDPKLEVSAATPHDQSDRALSGLTVRGDTESDGHGLHLGRTRTGMITLNLTLAGVWGSPSQVAVGLMTYSPQVDEGGLQKLFRRLHFSPDVVLPTPSSLPTFMLTECVERILFNDIVSEGEGKPSIRLARAPLRTKEEQRDYQMGRICERVFDHIVSAAARPRPRRLAALKFALEPKYEHYANTAMRKKRRTSDGGVLATMMVPVSSVCIDSFNHAPSIGNSHDSGLSHLYHDSHVNGNPETNAPTVTTNIVWMWRLHSRERSWMDKHGDGGLVASWLASNTQRREVFVQQGGCSLLTAALYSTGMVLATVNQTESCQQRGNIHAYLNAKSLQASSAAVRVSESRSLQWSLQRTDVDGKWTTMHWPDVLVVNPADVESVLFVLSAPHGPRIVVFLREPRRTNLNYMSESNSHDNTVTGTDKDTDTDTDASDAENDFDVLNDSAEHRQRVEEWSRVRDDVAMTMFGLGYNLVSDQELGRGTGAGLETGAVFQRLLRGSRPEQQGHVVHPHRDSSSAPSSESPPDAQAGQQLEPVQVKTTVTVLPPIVRVNWPRTTCPIDSCVDNDSVLELAVSGSPQIRSHDSDSKSASDSQTNTDATDAGDAGDAGDSGDNGDARSASHDHHDAVDDVDDQDVLDIHVFVDGRRILRTIRAPDSNENANVDKAERGESDGAESEPMRNPLELPVSVHSGHCSKLRVAARPSYNCVTTTKLPAWALAPGLHTIDAHISWGNKVLPVLDMKRNEVDSDSHDADGKNGRASSTLLVPPIAKIQVSYVIGSHSEGHIDDHRDGASGTGDDYHFRAGDGTVDWEATLEAMAATLWQSTDAKAKPNMKSTPDSHHQGSNCGHGNDANTSYWYGAVFSACSASRSSPIGVNTHMPNNGPLMDSGWSRPDASDPFKLAQHDHELDSEHDSDDYDVQQEWHRVWDERPYMSRNLRIHRKLQTSRHKACVLWTMARRRHLQSVFVETGTFEGEMTKLMSPYFDKVVSIEFVREQYHEWAAPLTLRQNVQHILGDSGEMLSRPDIQNEPKGILFWLDAHHDHSCPAKHELSAILARRDAIRARHRDRDARARSSKKFGAASDLETADPRATVSPQHREGMGRGHIVDLDAILIDDARLFGSLRAYPTLRDVAAMLCGYDYDIDGVADTLTDSDSDSNSNGLGESSGWRIGVERDIIRVVPPT